MNDKTLLPCPFCGGVPKSYWQGDSIDQDCGYWAVECCHIHVHTDDEAEAIAAWNTRAPQATRIEALEAALRSVAKTCREEIPLPYVGKMREVLLRNLAEWCEQALESSDA